MDEDEPPVAEPGRLEDGFWVAERIVTHRIRQGICEYLISYDGYGSDEWQYVKRLDVTDTLLMYAHAACASDAPANTQTLMQVSGTSARFPRRLGLL